MIASAGVFRSLLITALLIPAAGNACSCKSLPLEDQLSGASIVFLATIMESRIQVSSQESPRAGGQHVKVVAKFRVDETLKGDPAAVQALETRLYLPDSGVREILVSSCDVQPFIPGEQWMVFAVSGGIVEAGGCSNTRRSGDLLDWDRLKRLRR